MNRIKSTDHVEQIQICSINSCNYLAWRTGPRQFRKQLLILSTASCCCACERRCLLTYTRYPFLLHNTNALKCMQSWQLLRFVHHTRAQFHPARQSCVSTTISSMYTQTISEPKAPSKRNFNHSIHTVDAVWSDCLLSSLIRLYVQFIHKSYLLASHSRVHARTHWQQKPHARSHKCLLILPGNRVGDRDCKRTGRPGTAFTCERVLIRARLADNWIAISRPHIYGDDESPLLQNAGWRVCSLWWTVAQSPVVAARCGGEVRLCGFYELRCAGRLSTALLRNAAMLSREGK